ncbi:MAG: ABC transporter substrate-binding protein [Gemmatimonadales bacterium]
MLLGAVESSSPSHAQEPAPVKLGLVLAAAHGDTLRMENARRGAELAVQQVNRRGGVRGRAVQLVVREIRGPWGSGSKVIVDLVFEEGVRALLTSLDGRNAHLVLQVAAKSRTALVATWATDPTLSQAFVPWFARVVPDDRQLAAALVREIYDERGLGRVALVAAGTIDARMAREAFERGADSAGHAVSLSFIYRDDARERDSVAALLGENGIDAVVLLGPATQSLRMIQEIRRRGVTAPVFGTLSLALVMRNGRGSRGLGEVVVPDPELRETAEGRAFVKMFRTEYGSEPGPAAAYAYDGARVLLAAIERGGPDRASIRRSLAAGRHTAGATGDITLGEMGNRLTSVKLVAVRDGMPPR